MRRLRFLKILLPFLLLLFLVLLALQVRAPPPVHRPASLGSGDATESGSGVELHQSELGETTLDLRARLVESLENGRLRIEGLSRFALYREDKEPLVISAETGDVEGEPGRRTMRFDTDVVVRDPEDGLVLTLPGLEVDEAAGEARSSGGLRVEGATLEGSAGTLVYGLDGQPTRLFDVDLNDELQGELRAQRAVLYDGLDDMEFTGQVDGRRGNEYLRVERLRIKRWPDHQPREAHGSGNVRGAALAGSDGELLEFACERLDVSWSQTGQPERLELEDHASTRVGDRSITADLIRGALADPESGVWEFEAVGSVFAEGLVTGQPTWLRADRLEARLDGNLELQSARAVDHVEMEAPGTRAEADWVTLMRHGEQAEIRLFAAERRKTRISRERTRIAAERITTDQQGHRLVAESAVEATLMPEAGPGDQAAVPGLFRAEQAVHFVSERLDSTDSGAHLVFSGGVRGWQGERNLSADRMTLDQGASTLVAEDSVTSRFPRSAESTGTAEGDYVQITAERLDFDDSVRQAVYSGSVRVRVTEGWLEAARIEVDLGDDGEGIRQIRAYDDVRTEFRSEGDDGEAPQLVSGKADRLVYEPAEALIRFFGDKEPAMARRVGAGGETTTGRVLGYRLESGALEVESGAVKTPQKPR